MMRSFDLDRIGKKINALLAQLDRLSNQRYIRIAGNLLAIGFVIYLIFKNYNAMKALIETISISYNYFFIALIILVFVVVVIGGTSWQFINNGLGQTLSWFDAINVQLISNVSKYIPGTIWQYASKTHLSYKLGIHVKASSLAILIEFCQTISIGFFLMLIFLPNQIGAIEITNSIVYLSRVCGFLGIIFSFSLGIWGKVLLSKFPVGPIFVNPSRILLSSILILIGWILSVIAFWLISLGLDKSNSPSIFNYFFAYTSSLIGGLIVVPVPNGLGVREGIMIATLRGNLPEALAVLLAGISRLEITLAELLGYLLLRFVPPIFSGIIKKPGNKETKTN